MTRSIKLTTTLPRLPVRQSVSGSEVESRNCGAAIAADFIFYLIVMQIGSDRGMVWLDRLTGARKVGAAALLRARAAIPAPDLIDKIACSFVAVAAIAYVVDLLRQTRDGLTDGIERPLGDDFINFWSGSFLAWHQRAAEIYNFGAFHAFEQGVVGGHLMNYHYSYPPTMLVLTAPLAFMPYIPGLAVWLGAGWYAFYRAAHGDAGRAHALAGAGDAGGLRQFRRRTKWNLDGGLVRRRARVS
jgi:hypothetical protein